MSEPNSAEVKRKQVLHLLAGLILLGLALFGLYFLFKSKAPPPAITEKIETVEFESPLHVEGEALWMERAQNQLQEQAKGFEALKEQLQLLQQAKESQDKTAQDQATKVEKLELEVKEFKSQKRDPAFPGMPTASSIKFDTLPLKSSHKMKCLPAKNPLSFVPAGTFVRAISLGGADACAGISNQANPTPMLFRLLDGGTLPNHRQALLKNCIATAAAIGDVSSERGLIRLERLSCVKANGEVLDIPVEATVFGPDGKNGVRGNPLWREGSLLKRAFAAGTLSGLSNGLAQGATTTSFGPAGNAQSLVDQHKVFQYGLLGGLGSAAEKLAEYNIKRAEQYHPVIQLSAGTLVDIVFLKGFYLDGRKSNEDDLLATNDEELPTSVQSAHQLEEVRSGKPEEKRQNDNTHLAPLPLTEKQIESLKEKEADLGYL